jgi:hypothetical protein
MCNSIKAKLEATPNVASLLDTASGKKLLESILKVDITDEEHVLEVLSDDTTMAQLYKLETSLLDFKAITKTKMTGHWMPSALTFVLALMVCGMFLALFLIPPSEAYGQVLIMIAGTVSGAFSTAVAFWLGSSQGSWEKQKTLTNK